MTSIVIIGAGHGGVQTAASLREDGFDGQITLIDGESELPYHKPPLSKAFLKDQTAEPQPLRGEAFYTENAISLAFGERITRIDLPNRRLERGSAAPIHFDRLILATGSLPRKLAVPGAELGGILTLRNLADARAIRSRAATASDVVVVGGGFIGLEIAMTMAAQGRTVIVLETQDRLIGRAVGPAVSAHVLERLRLAGVIVRFGDRLERFAGSDGQVDAAVLADGKRIAAQLVIVGIGATADIALAADAGLQTGNGVTVDSAMRTSAPDVLAIGDAVNFRHWQTGADVRLESVQNASDQARHAARTLTGNAGAYNAVPWFWSDIGDMKLQMAGLSANIDRQILSGEPGENRFSVWNFAGKRLMSVDGVNRPADHMLARRMIAENWSPSHALAAEGGEAVKAAFMAK